MDLSVISIAVSISVSLAAIISPGIVTWMNNRHQLKIKKMELLQEQFEKNTLHEREIWENYLKYTGHVVFKNKTESRQSYGEYYFKALLYAPDDIRNDMTAINYLIENDSTSATNNFVFGNMPENLKKPFKWAGDHDEDASFYNVWAPDVFWNPDYINTDGTKGAYMIYFCTSSTAVRSVIAFGVSQSIEGPFTCVDTLIYSGFTKNKPAFEGSKDTSYTNTNIPDLIKSGQIEKYDTTWSSGDSYNNSYAPNAIDPEIYYDKSGKMWMTYGSWSGGIFLLEIDENTGKVIHPKADEKNDVDAYFGKRLIGGGHVAIEGPWIEYDKEAGYYYLFVSYGSLTSDGGYQIRAFRSKKVDGPYVDMKGNTPKPDSGDESFFGLKLSGNYMLPSLEKAYKATGHNSALIDSDGKRYIVNHTRFDDGTEAHEPRVHQYLLNEDGWPCMLPYATDGETVSEKGYDNEKIIGYYYVVDQDTTVDGEEYAETKIDTDDINPPILFVFGKDIKGIWTVKDGTYYVTIKYDDEEFKGVFCDMKDEAGTKCMTFSAVGKNKSLWGVKYYK